MGNDEKNRIKQEADLKLNKIYGLVFRINEHDFEEACWIVQNDIYKAAVKDEFGYLPMHLALRKNCSLNRLYLLLIDANPQAIRERDPTGHLPLHLACMNNTTLLTLFRILIEAGPEALMERDPGGDLPIHATIRHRCPKELVFELMKANPDTVEMTDKDGNLPLHMAIRFNPDAYLIERLLLAYPEAANRRNTKRDLPLHRAALFNLDLEVLRVILAIYPEAMMAKDAQGNLPIHLYFMNLRGSRPTDEMLHFFLEAHPASISTRNLKGCTPFAMFERYSDQIVDYKY